MYTIFTKTQEKVKLSNPAIKKAPPIPTMKNTHTNINQVLTSKISKTNTKKEDKETTPLEKASPTPPISSRESRKLPGHPPAFKPNLLTRNPTSMSQELGVRSITSVGLDWARTIKIYWKVGKNWVMRSRGSRTKSNNCRTKRKISTYNSLHFLWKTDQQV